LFFYFVFLCLLIIFQIFHDHSFMKSSARLDRYNVIVRNADSLENKKRKYKRVIIHP